jgi:2-polyprenyl-3-methyl-5-hydroxy-6-metoxy-1,4-benzoquinol methylase
MIRVDTKYPVAYNSPDHICPWGTMRDNTTDYGFIFEIEKFFGHKKIKTLDVGCSGGQLTIDFHRRGHLAVGIEGSDYSVKHARANWPEFYNKLLFTCDATKEYKVLDNSEQIMFDLITSWEVVEHIHPDDLESFFNNILNHMHDDSIFCASIAPNPDVINGHALHQSVFPKEIWFNEILPKYFRVFELPFANKVRYGDSFHTLLRKK